MKPLSQNRTKIVCTLGPATDRPGVLEKLLLAGMDVARLNAVHASEQVHRKRIQEVRRMAQRHGISLAVLLDLPGPKHRLGRLPSSSLNLSRGREITLGKTSGEDRVPLADAGFLIDLKPRDRIYLADGTIQLTVLRHQNAGVRCRVDVGGTVRSGSGLNLPDSKLLVRLPTNQDRPWIRFACREGVDWLGISFVRSPDDVVHVRRSLSPGARRPHLIAKIEKKEALENLQGIAEAADGLMVARGDLGVETPLETIPLSQKRIILEALRIGKPVITATQMLESMVEHSTPTRAEVTDVANAVLDGTDAVMLSAETAIGAHPIEAVDVLRRVLRETETAYPYETVWNRLTQTSWTRFSDAISLSACRLSRDQKAQAIVLAPGTHASAWSVARFRPQATIFALSHQSVTATPQSVAWGVQPVVVPSGPLSSAGILQTLRSRRLLKAGDPVIFITPSSANHSHQSDLVQILQVTDR